MCIGQFLMRGIQDSEISKYSPEFIEDQICLQSIILIRTVSLSDPASMSYVLN